ncbi:MAG: SBBP repeat-containing protein, partial [Betaproteobacteria bacterium]
MIVQSCRAAKSTKIALAMLGVCALLRTSGATVLPSAISSPLVMPASVAYGNLPLHFEPSSAAGGGGEEFIATASGRSFRIARDAVGTELGRTASSLRSIALRFEGASATAAIAGETPLEGRSHYFRGTDSGPPAPRVLDVPHFAKVRVAGLYPGIDAVYHAHGRDLEFDLVVAPGADPRRIRMRFDGIDSATFDRSGDLQLRSGDERVRQQRPNIYQEIDGRRVQVIGRYVSLGRHRFGLRLGRFDRTRSLVIDPILSYSTALGGKASDAATAIAVDSAGNAYIAGWTTSSNFPSVNAYDSRLGNGDKDVFVAKLNATGTALLYSTFIGGAKGQDYATGIAIDPQGNAYVTGSTSGNDFPVTANAYRAAPATGG